MTTIKKNEEPLPGVNGSIQTQFNLTQPMPPYMMAFVVCDKEDFDFDMSLANNNIPIRIWARKRYVDRKYTRAALELTTKIFNGLQDIFKNVDPSSLPEKIDIFAIPDYSVSLYMDFNVGIPK